MEGGLPLNLGAGWTWSIGCSFCHPSLRLHVAGWDGRDLVLAAGRQAGADGAAVARDRPEDPPVPVVAVVCFVGCDWQMPTAVVSTGVRGGGRRGRAEAALASAGFPGTGRT